MILKTSVLLAGLLLLPPIPASLRRRYDETGHETVLYAVARLSDLRPRDAEILANSSQSLDENDTTTAFSMTKAAGEIRDVAQGRASLKDLPHAVTGQVFHALTENRELVESFHVKRIQETLARGNRDLALFYLGQYLHFVADEVVHPTDPILGHGLEGHHPDLGEEDPRKLRIMMSVVREQIEHFEANTLQPLTEKRWAAAVDRLAHPDPRMETVAKAVERIWVPTEGDQLYKEWKAGKASLDWTSLYDREKAANARHKICEALSTVTQEPEHLNPRFYRLDAAGDPPDGTLGYKPSIDVLPFTALVARQGVLVEERGRWDKTAKAVALHLAVEGAKNLWEQPTGPGGIALDPELQFPPDLGEIQDLELGDEGLVLGTSRGRFVLDGIPPAGFATMLRSVASGEIPYITIGTQPSDRPGFARVNVAPHLRDTWEGELLYRADVQFKAIFAGYPLGDHRDLNIPGDPILTGYPGAGGDSVRLWITSSTIRLGLDGNRLVCRDAGMRIHHETRLLGDVVQDPELDAYTERLTSTWTSIGAKLSEFRALETLALECALAFWVRQHRLPTSEALWLLSPRPGRTPAYAPLVLFTGKDRGIAGGVSLAPEEEASAPGRGFLLTVTTGIAEDPGRRGMAAGAAGGLIVALLFAPALLAGKRASRGKILRAWGAALLAELGLSVLLSPLLLGHALRRSDAEFLSFLATVGAAPWILARSFAWVERDLDRGLSKVTRGVFALGLPLAAALGGIALALLTALLVDLVPTRSLERVLSAELATSNLLGQAVGCQVRSGLSDRIFVPAPTSMVMATRDFVLHAAEDGARPDVLESNRGSQDDRMPWKQLRRVTGLQSMTPGSDRAYYTPDGLLPYDPKR